MSCAVADSAACVCGIATAKSAATRAAILRDDRNTFVPAVNPAEICNTLTDTFWAFPNGSTESRQIQTDIEDKRLVQYNIVRESGADG